MSVLPLKQLLAENTHESAPELVQPLSDGAVRCVSCGHRCVIKPGRAGVCRVRFNDAGVLRVPWGYVAGVQIDPIEKKPFFHAYPGRDALSFGMLGCDFHCSYCQNWVTSQSLRDDRAIAKPKFCSADELIELAIENGAPVVVSTYNEPLITADWAVEVFKLARQSGLVCGFISNGNGTPQVLEFIRPYVDLYKIDLKGFDDKRYRELGGVLQNVLDTIKLTHQLGFWVEVVTLLVPGFNDGDDEIKGMADFLAGVNVDIPWHLTAFHPDYKMQEPSRTPVNTLLRAYEIAQTAGLRHVYAGNAAGAVGHREDTTCTNCGARLIRRLGFTVLENRMKHDACPDCAAKVPGVWETTPAPVRNKAAWPLALKMC